MVDETGWVAVDGVWSPTRYCRSVDPATGRALVSLPAPPGVVAEPGQVWSIRLAGGRVASLIVRRVSGCRVDLVDWRG